jgi:nitrogen fixation protein FixH
MIRTFTGWHMAVITVSFFAVIIAVNITLAVFAKSSWSGLVVENGYVASQTFNHDVEIARQQQALGWQFKFDVKRNAAEIQVLDRAGQPVRGLSVRMLLQRPTNDTEDRALDLSEKSPGLYAVNSVFGTGAWSADITAEGADKKPLRVVRRIFVN